MSSFEKFIEVMTASIPSPEVMERMSAEELLELFRKLQHNFLRGPHGSVREYDTPFGILIRLAAEKGNAEAMTTLSLLLDKNEEREEAQFWMREAYIHGDSHGTLIYHIRNQKKWERRKERWWVRPAEDLLSLPQPSSVASLLGVLADGGADSELLAAVFPRIRTLID